MREAPPFAQSATLCAEKVVAGLGFSCALLEERAVACWGAAPGEVPWFNGTPIGSSAAPIRIPLPGLVGDLWAGTSNVCARLLDDSVWCWGVSEYFTFGSGAGNTGSSPSRALHLAPVHAPDFDGALELALGGEGICAAIRDGGVKCTGQGDWSPPKAISIDEVFDAFEVGGSWPDWYAVRPDGSVWSWGKVRLPPENSLTVYASPDRTPFELELQTAARSVESGFNFSCALLVDGHVSCWGDNFSGIVAPPPSPSGAHSSYEGPRVLATVKDLVDLALGTDHACALADGGTLLCWGGNGAGQLGAPPSTAASHTPNPVPIANIVDVAAGAGHTCAVGTGGVIWCWGSNLWGESGVGRGADAGVPAVVLEPTKVRWDGNLGSTR